ncbi:hypothetical protein [Piscibacillus salipiscarius]|uniref:Uncharacterized protein n=1 Tax=Piscibacillus salipiscarius TaxID=299480 RepID=A0ABW5Q762_9BACI|nr:hypothetical protein [Piscibacillus salipiscarius]
MALEQEVISLLTIGFIVVIGVTALVTALFWWFKKSHHIGYLFTLIHLAVLSVAILYAINAIKMDPNHPMSSENISLQIGLAGLFWALSMACLVIAVIGYSKS